MAHGSLQSLRLGFKRAFTSYFLDLNAPVIADPTAAFAASYEYLSTLLRQLGSEEFMRRLDDETTHLAGEVEQDLRHRFRDRRAQPNYGDLEDRLRECFEQALARLHAFIDRPRVE
ncbi:MAG: hypothetical protein A2133_10910 [Actinobacteria bacterium RBG_16_64_13]|nr:MAG: hypothetical protein A2133_10910 [Actinobacteria bacterium RBG_16_64_13]